MDDGGTQDRIEASWLNKLTTKGRKANPKLPLLPALAGDFEADLILSGEGVLPKKKTLGSATIAGNIACSWDIDGDVGNIKALATESSWVLDVEGYVSSIYTTNTLDGAISASWFSKIYTKGDLAAEITASDKDLKGISISTLTVLGTANHSTVYSLGSMLTLSLGATEGSDFLAGVAAGAGRHADDHNDFINSLATIRSIIIRGLKLPKGSVMPRCVLDSNFSAATIGSVSLINTEFDTPGSADEFGIFARNAGIPSAIAGTEVKSVKHTDKSTGLTWTWKPTAGNPPGEQHRIDDFVICIL